MPTTEPITLPPPQVAPPPTTTRAGLLPAGTAQATATATASGDGPQRGSELPGPPPGDHSGRGACPDSDRHVSPGSHHGSDGIPRRRRHVPSRATATASHDPPQSFRGIHGTATAWPPLALTSVLAGLPSDHGHGASGRATPHHARVNGQLPGDRGVGGSRSRWVKK